MRAVAGFVAAAAAAVTARSAVVVTAVVTVAATLVVAPAAPAAASAADLASAQKAANQAATDYAAAQSRVSVLDSQIRDLQARRSAAQAQLDALASALRSTAISKYIQGRNRGPDVQLDSGLDLAEQTRRTTLAGYVTREVGDSVDRYRVVAEDLAASEKELTGRQKEAAGASAQLKSRIVAAQNQLVRLEKLEADRKAKEAAQQRA
ncbi:MAG TPA: hypothetical protein VGH94_15565, partial [Acidimicrobiales bacterium]